MGIFKMMAEDAEVSPINSPANNTALSSIDLASAYTQCPDDDERDTITSAGNYIINRYDPSDKVSPVKEQAFFSIVNEYMDIRDYETNKRLFSLDEAEQNTVLLSLTGKLYNMIVDKIDEIDFGDIPNTRGDITRLPKYHQMLECLDTMEKIFEQYKEKPECIINIQNAIKYIEDDKALYMSCFAGDIAIGISIYNTMTLACVASISYMIATCIEYIKDPNSKGLKAALDKTGVAKVKDSLLYENLCKFNDACRKGEIENSLRPLIRNKAKGFGAAAILTWVAVSVGVIALIMASLTMVRDCVYFFYASRARVSKYFDIQADLLEMNVEELKSNDIQTVDDKNKVIKRQLAIAAKFRKVADAIAVEATQAERKATKEISVDTKAYKIDEVETEPGSSDSPLF